jgi:hypothetical protein
VFVKITLLWTPKEKIYMVCVSYEQNKIVNTRFWYRDPGNPNPKVEKPGK